MLRAIEGDGSDRSPAFPARARRSGRRRSAAIARLRRARARGRGAAPPRASGARAGHCWSREAQLRRSQARRCACRTGCEIDVPRRRARRRRGDPHAARPHRPHRRGRRARARRGATSSAEAAGARIVLALPAARRDRARRPAAAHASPRRSCRGVLGRSSTRCRVDAILDSGQSYGGRAYRDCIAAAHAHRVPVVIARPGMRWSSGDGVTLDVFAPQRPFLADTGDDVNENSIVAMLHYRRPDGREFRALFTGDAGESARSATARDAASTYAPTCSRSATTARATPRRRRSSRRSRRSSPRSRSAATTPSGTPARRRSQRSSALRRADLPHRSLRRTQPGRRRWHYDDDATLPISRLSTRTDESVVAICQQTGS